ncbi:HD domain-containing protein [Marinilabiliaceae bacterium JC017]|nr:HD domain-containing protein [Marinilabiliaceae bacterium JC017]
MSSLQNNIEHLVREKLAVTDAGHDWWHAVRVRNNAMKIAEQEGGDLLVIEVAALIHDLVDDKFFEPEEAIQDVGFFLAEQGLDNDRINQVVEIITTMSFSKELEGLKVTSLESRIVQDADRLDAIGAIGIARAFSYGGHKQREMYNPDIAPVKHADASSYRNNGGHTINHFYEKLLFLKDKMKTAAGRQMAQQRHGFMEAYLEQFYAEWG